MTLIDIGPENGSRSTSISNAVTFVGTETERCRLEGLTITGGYSGIAGHGTHATVRNNTVVDNGITYSDRWDHGFDKFKGGGVTECNGLLCTNTVSDNIGIAISKCSGSIFGNKVSGNGPYYAITSCDGTIAANVIFDNAGGLQSCGGTITDNVIAGNHAASIEVSLGPYPPAAAVGGGLCNCNGDIIENLIIDNSADAGGGLAGCGGNIINNTIVGNRAYHGLDWYGERWIDGGDGFRSCPGPFVNCIIADSLVGSGAATFSHCLIAGSGGSGLGWNRSLGTDGGGNIDADPNFLNAADPDGPDDAWLTEDDGLRLQGASPCIDAADGSAAPTTDILGLPRYDHPSKPNTGTGTSPYADIGAYEYGNP